MNLESGQSGGLWRPSSSLTESMLEEAAGWIYLMDKSYYDLFSNDSGLLIEKLKSIFLTRDTEIEPTKFLFFDDVMIGFVNFFPGEQLMGRRLNVLKCLLPLSSSPGAIREKLRGFSGALKPLPIECLYLSKLFVSPVFRGNGFASLLMQVYAAEAKKMKRKEVLHVEKNNEHAVKLYLRLGFFSADADNNGDYFVMMRN